jgi:hypothetical protein
MRGSGIYSFRCNLLLRYFFFELEPINQLLKFRPVLRKFIFIHIFRNVVIGGLRILRGRDQTTSGTV